MASEDQTVEQLFGDVLDRKPEDRRAFLDRACEGAPELRQRVEALLLANEQAGSFLEAPLLGCPEDPADIPKTSPKTNGSWVSPDSFDRRAASRFEPGQLIADRFTVIRYIDHGGMGEVYEVADSFLQDVHVALKIILPEIAGSADSSRRFEQEVLLARKVTHPNLCPIYDIAHYDDPPPSLLFLTMKLLAGETLSSRLRQPEPISREEVIAIVRQMVAGLGAIHAAGVIHRDIKPNNVMLDKSGPDLRLTIMDFGLARLHESDETMGRSLMAGTPGYMAPEIILGPSQATDLFSLGVLLHEVLARERPRPSATSGSVEPSPALDTADVPPEFISAVKELLSIDPSHRVVAFNQLQSRSASSRSVGAWPAAGVSNQSAARLLTRRQFAVGSALLACSAAGATIWKWDSIYDLLHPLPVKRFVALLTWPPSRGAGIEPMLLGVIDAIASELARAEAFDRNLLVIAPPHKASDLSAPAQLNNVRESLGANLVFALSGTVLPRQFHLLLQVLDPSSNRTLRQKHIDVSPTQQQLLPERAVRVAAGLLDISAYKPDDQRSKVGTDNPEAFAAFQAAEASMKQENDAGLDTAIEKYKLAIELDPHYAMANAMLAWAYCRFFWVHKNPSALSLAEANCAAALALDPQLVEGHLALASVLEYRGDKEGAFRETGKALALDPSNPKTLVYQAQLYFRSNQWSDAEQTFERVLKARPNFWWAHHELGVLYNSQGRYAEALNQFRAVTLEVPKSAIAFSNVGSVYLEQGKLDEATSNLARSLSFEQTDSAASTMAEALRAGGKYVQAVDFAKKAVDLGPEEGDNWLELGDCYSFLPGHQNDAKNAYRKSASLQEQELQTDPASGPDWMILALARIKSGYPQTAPDLIEKAEHYYADDMDSQLYKARILELLGRREDALNTISRCFARGATLFQLETMPDMGELRKDPRYLAMSAAHSAPA